MLVMKGVWNIMQVTKSNVLITNFLNEKGNLLSQVCKIKRKNLHVYIFTYSYTCLVYVNIFYEQATRYGETTPTNNL
jgi:hypothetical protein